MKTFKLVAAQGEVTIRRIGDVSGGLINRKYCSPLTKENGKFVVGHSETGHHHVLSCADSCEVLVLNQPPTGMRILYAILENPTSLDHLRECDTHESIMMEPGIYEFRIAREYDPYAELVRQSQD